MNERPSLAHTQQYPTRIQRCPNCGRERFVNDDPYWMASGIMGCECGTYSAHPSPLAEGLDLYHRRRESIERCREILKRREERPQ